MFQERVDKTQSPLEERFLEDCATVGLLVEPQYEISGIHCDFAIPKKKIAIECDSKMYHSTLEASKNDSERDKIYNSSGWTVIRIPGDSIYRCGEHIAQNIKNEVYLCDGPGCVYLINPCPDEYDD